MCLLWYMCQNEKWLTRTPRCDHVRLARNHVTVLELVGGAPAQGWGETHRASPIHRRRARAASFIRAYLLLSRTASAKPPEQRATFARSIFPHGASGVDILA